MSASYNSERTTPQASNSQLPPPGKYRNQYLHENKGFLDKSRRNLENWKRQCDGGRCFILANGPSINHCDIEALRNEVCFGVNATHLLFANRDWFPQYYCVTQRDRLLENIDGFRDLSNQTRFFYCDGLEYPTPHRFFEGFNLVNLALLNQRLRIPTPVMKYWPIKNKVGNYFNHRLRQKAFSDDILDGVFLGKSVVFTCLQVAYWLGYRKIYLLGVDMNYSGTKTHFFGNTSWVPDQDYEVELAPLFRSFSEALQKRGVQVFNCSMDSRVEDFEKVEFDKVTCK